MSTTNTDRWVEMQPVGSHTLRIELNRVGHLWHGQAAKLTNRMIDRTALATAVGADFENVRFQVLQSAQQALKPRH